MEDTRTLVHRIRNDLQLVSSIIHAEMESARSDEARAALEAMDRRLLAINLSYTGEETTSVHLPRYLSDICGALGQTLEGCPDRSVGTVTARRIGMIAAEALGAAKRATTLSVTASGEHALRVSILRASASSESDIWLRGLCRELVADLMKQLGGRIISDGPQLLSFEIAEP